MNALRAITALTLLGAISPSLLPAQSVESFTFTTNRMVPDGNASGLSDVHNLNSAIGNISSLKVRLKLAGEFNGDLYGYVRHSSGFAILLNRPGKTAGNSAGYPDSGFDVSFQTGAANGDIHTYQSVLAPVDGAPLTGIWEPDGRIADPANVTELSARTTSLTNFNGLNAAGDWTLYLADVESGGTNMLAEWGLDISGAAYPALAWPSPADIVYGTSLNGTQLNASASYNSAAVPGTFAYSPAAGSVLNAGSGQTLTVTFTPADTTRFLPVSTNVPINVLTAPLIVAADSTNREYGSANPDFTGSIAGLQNGDAISVSYSTAANSGSGVGSYAIIPVLSDPSGKLANYSVTTNSGALLITPATLTVAADDKTRAYGSANPALTASISGYVNGENSSVISGSAALTTTANMNSPAGTYEIAAALGSLSAANYAFAFSSGTLTVGKAVVTITANNASRVYGAANPTLTASYSGFVLGQGTGDLASLATIATTANAGSAVGTYPITASGAASPNYAFTYADGTLTVEPAATTGSIVSSANPVLPGANVTLTATVNPVTPSAATPVGTVHFRIDGAIAGSANLSGGIATLTLNSLSHGSHAIVAEYPGTQNFVGTTNALGQDLVINTAPVASGFSLERYPMQGVKVRLSVVRALASDADNDDLVLTVSGASANGGTLSVSGGWVFYTPADGFTNADSFTYTVTDGHGGSATGTIAVNIKVDTTPTENLTITSLGNGSFRINGSGIANRTYRLQFTPTLNPADWQDIVGGSVTADGAGKFEFTDTPGEGSGFYRTVYP